MKTKTIIALSGSHNTGKTETLNYLIDKLLDSGGDIIYGNKSGKDKRVCISYKNKKIAISTFGDGKEELDENIELFKNRNCDICITATRARTRSRCKTCQILSAYAEEIGTDINWIDKVTDKSNIDLINKAQAEDIKSFIDSIIDKAYY